VVSPDEVYNYDPYGRLYEITAGSDSTFFEYETRSGPGTGGQSVAAEYSGYNATLTYGNMTHRYVFGPGMDEPLVQYVCPATGGRPKNGGHGDTYHLPVDAAACGGP
jgi:hypothetical protein